MLTILILCGMIYVGCAIFGVFLQFSWWLFKGLFWLIGVCLAVALFAALPILGVIFIVLAIGGVIKAIQ